MTRATIKAEPTGRPGRPLFAGRELGRKLADCLSQVDADWTRIGQFWDKPRQAYWFAASMRRRHPGYEFTASIDAAGVGRLYARRVAGA